MVAADESLLRQLLPPVPNYYSLNRYKDDATCLESRRAAFSSEVGVPGMVQRIEMGAVKMFVWVRPEREEHKEDRLASGCSDRRDEPRSRGKVRRR